MVSRRRILPVVRISAVLPARMCVPKTEMEKWTEHVSPMAVLSSSRRG